MKDIENAIKTISPKIDDPSLYFHEFKGVLQELNYISAIKRFENKLRNNDASNKDLSQAKDLLKMMWKYLNPYNEETVEKSAIFDFMLILMFNLGHLSDKLTYKALAKFLITYY